MEIKKIIYEEKVITEDLPIIPQKMQDQIQHAIETKLLVYPEHFSIPLKGTLKPLRKFRVGDYRVLHMIDDDVITVYGIAHRSKVYR